MRRSRPLAAALLVGAGLLWPGGGAARTALGFPYPLPVVYNTALRFLRIDRGCQITERDPEAAYLLFDCRDGNKPRRGALELYAIDRGVKGHLNLLDEPRYMELRLLELLGQKLREERGDPPQPPTPPPAPPPQPARPTDGGIQ